VERLRGVPPDDSEWRADALARSRHTRLEEFLVEPVEDRDPGRAAMICSELARRGLRDFAPALVLLPPRERRRVQALAAFGSTLFDFARQSSLEGEKLSQLNRWHFDLEAALDGAPPAQPVFMLLAATDDERPWPRAALEDLVGCARRRALHRRPDSAAAADNDSRRLGAALAAALLPDAAAELAPLAAALLRLGRLLDLGDDTRRHQAGLPADVVPESWGVEGPLGRRELDAAIRAECSALRPHLATLPAPDLLPRPWRRALTYALLAARHLLERMDALGAGALEARPQLGAWKRLSLVARSRWLPL
jgi:phytoene/squalene synthetase